MFISILKVIIEIIFRSFLPTVTQVYYYVCKASYVTKYMYIHLYFLYML